MSDHKLRLAREEAQRNREWHRAMREYKEMIRKRDKEGGR